MDRASGGTSGPLPVGEQQDVLGPRVALLELGCLILMVELIEWVVPLSDAPRRSYVLLAVVILAMLVTCQIRDGFDARALGIRLDNLPRVLVRLSLPLAAFVLLTLAVGYAFGSVRFGRRFYSMWISVPWWAFLQQYMLLAFAKRRLMLVLGPGTTHIVATAVLFSLLHLPNPVLAAVCFAGGLVWARVYDRDPNLLANMITHTAASAFLATSLPSWLLRHMVVGYNFLVR